MTTVTPIKPLPSPPVEVRAPAVLLIGAPGSGKTHSLVTLLQSGMKLFVIVTEPGGVETLIDACTRNNIPLTNLHYRVIQPARPGFNALREMAGKVTSFSFDMLSKMSPTSRSNAQFLAVVDSFNSFKCDHCGTDFGDISKFGSDCAVALDSLSGLSHMAMDLTIGDKVTAHQGEWGVAMGMLDKLILTLTSNLTALFVLTAHFEREQDEASQSTKLMVSTLGRKLAPKLPRFFSEVVFVYTEGSNYYWTTTASQIDLKHRALPLGSKLPPTFQPVVDAYRKRLEALKTTIN